jgi:hypothetical protein
MQDVRINKFITNLAVILGSKYMESRLCSLVTW